MLHKTSLKSYFIQAVYNWCTDCGYAPQLLVYYHPCCILPKELIDSDNEAAFNISWEAVKDLKITPEYISFQASFDGGVSGQDIFIPLPCVRGIYEGETADGMMFELIAEELANLENQYQNRVNEEKNPQKEQRSLFKRIK